MFLFNFIPFLTVRQTFAKALSKSSKEVGREETGVKTKIKFLLYCFLFKIFEWVINDEHMGVVM